MTEHNPYHGITFYYVEGNEDYTLAHWNAAWYATPHSGSVYLFNRYGRDNMKMVFSSPVIFQGAWVGCPINDKTPPEFWFEGYLGASKVDESEVITTERNMQWLQADFDGPIDTLVLRRNPHVNDTSPENSYYTIDDVTFDTITVRSVTIDIKPGGEPNSINLRSKGVTPVAILTTEDFDASTVNPATVTLEGVAPVKSRMQDVDGDGDLDLLLHFSTKELAEVLSTASTEATLTGETNEGIAIEGTDSVKIPKGSK
jgi:hypothetical protein